MSWTARRSSRRRTLESLVSLDPEQLLQERLERLREASPGTWELLQREPVLLREARQVLLGSEFALQSLLQDPTALRDLWSSGRLAAPTTPADYAAFFKREVERWGAAVKAAKIDPQ